MAKKKTTKSSSLYEKAEDLPDNRKQKYDSILQDFDKQIETFIEQIYSNVSTLEKQIKSQFKVAKLQLPRNVKSQKAEDFLYQNSENNDNVTVECAKVIFPIFFKKPYLSQNIPTFFRWLCPSATLSKMRLPPPL